MPTEFIGVYLPVSEVFPDTESNFETFISLLKRLSLTDALFWCARLNLVISKSEVDHKVKQEFCLKQLLSQDEIRKVNDFTRKHGGASKVTIFFRGQLLELIRWLVLFSKNLPGDGTTFEGPKMRQDFVKAALIVSDIWAQRVFSDRFSMKGGKTVARNRALGPIRKSVEATLRVSMLPQFLGRGWLLFTEYFPRHYHFFEKEFRLTTHIALEEYYVCVAAIIINFMSPKIGSGLFNTHELIHLESYGQIFEKYLSLECQTADELKNAFWSSYNNTPDSFDDTMYNYLPLRERPIFHKKEDGRAIILDPLFYSEKASIGPLFLLPRNSREKAFAAFGKAFEDYVGDILKRMFPDLSSAKNKRISCNILGKDEDGSDIEIDACLNDLNELVLFEIKFGLIREDKVLSSDYESFTDHLKDKYVKSIKGDKGIGQLARVIKILASQKWLGNDFEFARAEKIYPILVLYDPLLNAQVYGHFFANEFENLLEPDKKLQNGILVKGSLHVIPPIIVTIDDLENLETSIEHFGFRDLLRDYSNSHPDRLESLHNFLVSSHYKNHMFHNKNLAKAGLDIIEKSAQAIFRKLPSITPEQNSNSTFKQGS